jgi:hypothetical protein
MWGIAAIGLGVSMAAEQTQDSTSTLTFDQSDVFKNVDSYALIQALPLPVELSNLFSVDSLRLGELQKVSTASRRRSRARDGKDSMDSKDVSARSLVRSAPFYYGGEIGAFYGHATGKFGGDAFGGYVIGTVGNDKVQITAGSSYEEWDTHSPRFHSFGPR